MPKRRAGLPQTVQVVLFANRTRQARCFNRLLCESPFADYRLALSAVQSRLLRNRLKLPKEMAFRVAPTIRKNPLAARFLPAVLQHIDQFSGQRNFTRLV